MGTPSTTLRYEYAAALVFAADDELRFGNVVSSGSWRIGTA
jgi:hypothetical protein